MTAPVTHKLAGLPPGTVAVPAVDWMWTRSVLALVALAYQGLPPGSLFRISGGESVSPAANRNALIRDFLNRPSQEWICFIDSDMTPEPDTIARLLSRNVDVVGALCFQRVEPFSPCYRDLPGDAGAKPWVRGAGELRAVKWLGTGCLLVRRRVIEAIPFPHFEHPTPGAGEDILFCQKAQERGFKVFMDCDLVVGHMTSRPIDAETAFMYRSLHPEMESS